MLALIYTNHIYITIISTYQYISYAGTLIRCSQLRMGRPAGSAAPLTARWPRCVVVVFRWSGLFQELSHIGHAGACTQRDVLRLLSRQLSSSTLAHLGRGVHIVA